MNEIFKKILFFIIMLPGYGDNAIFLGIFQFMQRLIIKSNEVITGSDIQKFKIFFFSFFCLDLINAIPR